MSVDVVIVSYNTRDLLRECLRSALPQSDASGAVRVFVVDNAGSDGSVDMVRAEFPEVQLVALPENVGFGGGNNRGAELGAGDYILFLNSDARLTDGALTTLTAFLDSHPDCAAVGPRLVYPNGEFQRSCRRFPTLARGLWSVSGLEKRFANGLPRLRTWLTEAEHVDGMPVDMVSGACFLARRVFFEKAGGFDENLFLYEEEFDLFIQAARMGMEVRYCAKAEVVHGAGASVDSTKTHDLARFHMYRSKYYGFRKHYGRFMAWLAYMGDLAVYGVTGSRNRLLGRPAEALHNFAICRMAYTCSFLAGEEARTSGPRPAD